MQKRRNHVVVVYYLELDTSPESGPDAASYFQLIIGILRWMTGLGRIKIITKTSLLSLHPEKGT